MKGVWMGDENNFNYKYNGIEQNDNFDIDLSFAHYRTLDPTIGRWMQVDPYAEPNAMYSPYNSMNNNPISNVDPLGDNPFLYAAIGGAVASGIALAIDKFDDGDVDNHLGYYVGAFAIGATIGFGVDQGWFTGSGGNTRGANKVNQGLSVPKEKKPSINSPLPTLLRPISTINPVPTPSQNVVNPGVNTPTGNSVLTFNGNTLSLYSTHTNSSRPGIFRTFVDSWPAVSGGANSAGIPPNITTTANNLRTRTTAAMVRDGVGFSMDIPNQFDSHPQLNRMRTLLRIHPDGASNGIWSSNNGSASCIALQCNAADLNAFAGHMRNHLANHNNITIHIIYNRVVPATAR